MSRTWATTSVSVSETSSRPAASTSSRSGRKFSMMPLWTTARWPARWGWALAVVGPPWVAQRVWPMPAVAGAGGVASRMARSPESLPASLMTSRPEGPTSATPAES